MTYDWTQHVKNDRVNRRPGGVEASGRVFLGRAAPEGIRFTPQFYLQWAFDNVMRSLSYASDSEKVVIYDLLMWMAGLDEDLPFLTAYQRVEYAQRNSEAADVDLNQERLF